MWLKRKKCTFLADEVVYLRHKIDQHGLHPVQDKVGAIQKARSSENVQELQACLDLLNYYRRFLYNLSTVLAPLHKLLCKGQKWLRGPPQQRGLQRAKELLLAEVLAHYDPNKPIVLQCYASNYGLGEIDMNMAPYHCRRDEVSMQDGCVFWIARVMNVDKKCCMSYILHILKSAE